jgi:hypothetical protein
MSYSIPEKRASGATATEMHLSANSAVGEDRIAADCNEIVGTGSVLVQAVAIA